MKGRLSYNTFLLDPPLHEFLPNPEELADKVRSMGEAEAANFQTNFGEGARASRSESHDGS